jgi:nucleoside 2-deoxyribosyltransferase
MSFKDFREINVYLAAPFGEVDSEKRFNAEAAAVILRRKGFNVYTPWDYIVPHAWDYPNDEWGLMVFMNDIRAIDEADIVVVLSYGRESTAGTNWEAGYAFGIGKMVIVVEMTDEVMSLMVANGRYATLKGLGGLEDYKWETKPRYRTKTEQK